MSEQQKPVEEKDEPFSRFQKLARALFGVDKRDVPKHEPKKRTRSSVSNNDVRGDV